MTAGDDGPLSLPAFVAGPQSQGRGYRVLHPAASLFSGSADLAMILMEWSRSGEREMVGCFPVVQPEGGAVIFRARHLGSATLGEIAYLYGVVADAAALRRLDHRPETLLALIPPPEEATAFAEAALTVPAPPAETAPHSSDREGFGLAWKDRLVLVDEGEDREAVLLEALAAVAPPEQRPRIRGWVSSARLVARGSLNLIDSSQLIVADAAPAVEGMRHLPWRHSAQEGDRGARVEAPAAWAVWLDFRRRIEGVPHFAELLDSLDWSPAYAVLPPAQVAQEALRMASGLLAPARMVDLLLAMIAEGEPFAGGAETVLLEYMEALHVQGAGQEPLHRLLHASPPLRPELRAALLAPPAAATGTGASGSRAVLLDEGLRLAQSDALLDDPPLRDSLVRLIAGSLSLLAPGAAELASIRRLVEQWPEAHVADLMPLTNPLKFQTVIAKSKSLGDSLALRLLRRHHYANDPVLQLSALRAIASMRAATKAAHGG